MLKGLFGKLDKPAATLNYEAPKKKITRSFEEFFDHIKSTGYTPATCIDVGAASGTPSIYEAFPDALHIAFEPLSDFQEELKAALSLYNHEIHSCALMDKPGEQTILRLENSLYTSSLMHHHDESNDKVIKTRVDTLDGVLAERDLAGPILIKTDCQGADLLVIRGAKEVLKKTSIVIMETSLYKFWGENHPDIFDIMHYMKSRGFVVYDILGGLTRPYDNALAQVDLVFVRQTGRFRKTHQW